MGVPLSSCTKLLFEHGPDEYFEEGAGGPCQYPRQRNADMGSPPQPTRGPQLALRIEYAPIEESLGARASPFATGDEVAIVKLDKVKGWEPMGWRQEHCAKQRAAQQGAGGVVWPTGPRFSAAQRFWAAKVVASDGRGGFEDHWCMLQMAVQSKDRSMECAQLVVDDAKDAASYAHRFNQQTARSCDVDPAEVPGIRVCPAVACYVLGSAIPDFATPGEAVVLTSYPVATVKKFVFDGGEDFVELPQAFFHYVAWASGSRELVADLQGVQDDRDVLIVDPVMLRASKPTIGDLIGTLATTAIQGSDQQQQQQTGDAVAAEQHRFDLWHPRCGQLCRGFDPQRRSAQPRKACGLSMPTCGAGGA